MNIGLLLAATLVLAINLRPAMAAIGPLLDMIEASNALGSAHAGLLTTLPVFLMGVGALGVRRLRMLLGERIGVAFGAALIAASCAARLRFHDGLGLIATAAVAGIGIAMIQSLVPGILKRAFGASIGRVMALYTTSIMGGAAIAAASAASLSNGFGWTSALAIWSLPAIGAASLWLIASKKSAAADRSSPSSPQPSASAFVRSRRAWSLLLFFGIGTGAYTLVLAWLPPYLVGLGRSREWAGYLLAGLTLTEVAAGLAVSAFIGRCPDRRGPLIAALLSALAGLLLILTAPLTLAVPAALLLGLGIGALFPLSLIVAMDHVDDPVRSGELVAFVQGGGYMIASLTPFLAGWVRDYFSDLSGAWTAMAAGVVLLIAMALRYSPASYVRLEARL